MYTEKPLRTDLVTFNSCKKTSFDDFNTEHRRSSASEISLFYEWDVGQDEMHRDNYGVDCLHFAAMEGHGKVTGMLLNYGADVNSIDDQGRTSLLLAAQYGRLDAMMVLISQGADVNLSAHNGMSL